MNNAICAWQVFDHRDGVYVVDFDHEQAGLIQSGKRKQIIVRGWPLKHNALLYLVHGRRSTNCKRLRTTKAESVQSIFIDTRSIIVDNRVLCRAEADVFAEQDGFASLSAMLDFYRHTQGLPIEGQLVRWM